MSEDKSRNRMEDNTSGPKSWTSSPASFGSTSKGRGDWYRGKSNQSSWSGNAAGTGYKASSKQDWKRSKDWRKREKEPGPSSEPPRKRYTLDVEPFECNLNQGEIASDSISIQIRKEVIKSLSTVMPYSDTFDRRPWFKPLDEDRRKALIHKAAEQDMINLKDILARNIGDEDAIKTFVEKENPSWSGIFNFHDKNQTIYATWSAKNDSRGVICSDKGSEVRGDLSVVSPDP